MVSVIIPIYNGEQYIKKCLDSLHLDKNISLEVIAVNDGSKDGSSALLHEYAKQYTNLKVIDKENQGSAQARFDGIAAASGDFIAFLDVDDYVESDIYTKMEEKATQAGADIVVCDYIEEYPARSVPVKNVFDGKQEELIKGEDVIRHLHHRTAIFPYPWNKLYRASLLRQVQFPTGNFVGEDYNMLLQLFSMTDRTAYLEQFGYHYVLTENSVSRRGYTPATALAYEHFKEDYAWVCEKYPHMERDVTHYLMTEYMAIVISMGRNKTYDKKMIKEIKRFVKKGLFGFLRANYVPVKMKGSAVALCISYRLLIFMYRILSK
ncbi:MAG: glycosyltransferase [Clostridia bacterium]|nr:glycosyltransferase [Clostridia bacterium]